jgi:predicted TIM-barrel fold metal-dependent hydrolase
MRISVGTAGLYPRGMPVVDVHAHLEPRMLDVPHMIEQLDARGIDRVVLIPAMNDPLPHTPERLLRTVRWLMRSPLHPIVRAINAAVMTRSGDLKLGGQTYAIYRRPDNATVARVMRDHPARFLGWIFLNPLAGDGPDQLEEWRATSGFIGVKLHPHWHGWPIEAALPIARRCEELGLPILIHLGSGARGKWRVLTEACPRLRVLFAHCGMPHFQRMWHAIKDDPRLWVDVSSPYLDEPLVRDAIAVLGEDRVMYGTDAPYGFHRDDGSYDYGAIKQWVERAPASARGIDKMLGDNAGVLLGDART